MSDMLRSKDSKKFCADIMLLLQRQGKKTDGIDEDELTGFCELFLVAADANKTHEKSLKECVSTIQSIVNDITWEGIEAKDVSFSFWKTALDIAKPIAREALTTLTKAALDSAISAMTS